jgi:uncharacterized protein (DUF2141 family)
MHFLPLLLLILLSSVLPVAAEQSATGTLRVEVTGVNAVAGGVLRVALFRGEAAWPKLKNALQLQEIAVSTERVAVEFVKLAYGDDYAIEIHHDENGNGKFDMRWLPYPRPKEGVGVSNNTFGFGHPDFEDARFSVQAAEQTMQVEMRY